MTSSETAFALLSIAWFGLMVVTYRGVLSGCKSSDEPYDRERSVRTTLTRGMVKMCTSIGLLQGLYSQRAALDIGVGLSGHHRILALALALGVALRWVLVGATVGWIAGCAGALASEKRPSTAALLATAVTFMGYVVYMVFNT